MAKYDPLYEYLKKQDKKEVSMTFGEVAEVIGDSSLTESALIYPAWWTNERNPDTSHVQAKAWLEAGFKANPDIKSKKVTFSKPFDIYEVLSLLARKHKRMFVSEGEAQVEMIEAIRELYPSYKVIAEYPYFIEQEEYRKLINIPESKNWSRPECCSECDNSFMNVNTGNNWHIDIFIITSENEIIPIELKSKTKKEKLDINDERTITLKTQSAYNDNAWAYLRDIWKIECIKACETKFIAGYSIFFANDENYLKETVSKDYSRFWIGNNIKTFGRICRKKKKCSLISFSASYTHIWKDFYPCYSNSVCTEPDGTNRVWYLMNEVKP